MFGAEGRLDTASFPAERARVAEAERRHTSVDIAKSGAAAFMRAKALLLRQDLVVLGAVFAIIVVAAQVVNAAGHQMPGAEWFLRNVRFYLLICALVLLGEAVLRLLAERPARPLRHLSSPAALNRFASRIAACTPVIAIALLMPAFSAVKSSIGRINPFEWDATFIRLDQAIHGMDPWRLLHPLMGHPAVTYVASNLYHAWFLLLYLGPILFAFYARDRRLRLSFFLGYVATWTIVGMVFATLLSSVGPCFVGPLFGNPHFAELMAYLQHADRVHPLAVLDVQRQLLEWYQAEDAGLGRGITAMPSMHVALAWLYVLATWPIDRRLGCAFAVFFIAIQLSSVHLAYHYAVDGYLAVVLVTAIWFASRRVAAWMIPQDRDAPESASAQRSAASEFLNLSAIFTLFRTHQAAPQAENGQRATRLGAIE